MGGVRPGARVCRLAALAAISLLLASRGVRSAGLAGGEIAPEYQVKAAFLANFAKFVDWPPARIPAPGAPFVVAVLGADPFGPHLKEATAGKQIAGHPVELRAAANSREAAAAHVVFISESERGRLPAVIKDLQPAKVLTVGDSDGFAAAGVIINLYVEERRVRFEVNQAAASRAGLRLSAQILAIARPAGGGS